MPAKALKAKLGLKTSAVAKLFMKAAMRQISFHLSLANVNSIRTFEGSVKNLDSKRPVGYLGVFFNNLLKSIVYWHQFCIKMYGTVPDISGHGRKSVPT